MLNKKFKGDFESSKSASPRQESSPHGKSQPGPRIHSRSSRRPSPNSTSRSSSSSEDSRLQSSDREASALEAVEKPTALSSADAAEEPQDVAQDAAAAPLWPRVPVGDPPVPEHVDEQVPH